MVDFKSERSGNRDMARPGTLKSGRKAIPESEKKKRAINTYLQENDYQLLLDKLKGRPVANYLRELILMDIGKL